MDNNNNPYVRLVRKKKNSDYILQVLFNIPKDYVDLENIDIDTTNYDKVYVRFHLKKYQEESKSFESASKEIPLIRDHSKIAIHVQTHYMNADEGFGPEPDGETIIHFESAVQE